MQGLMQSWPLTVDRVLDHAASWRPNGEIFTAVVEGAPSRMTYAQLGARVRRLATALAGQGVKRGDAVAVLGANSARQLEAWYAIIGMGAVCQPLNPDLPHEHLTGLLGASGAKIVFADPEALAALEPALQGLSRLKRVVVMSEAAEAPGAALETVMHDALIETAGPQGADIWGGLDEDAPAVLVHAVGVLGAPRTTVWSHRSAVLQGMISGGRDALDLSSRDAVLPLVPFWRAAGWGVVFAAPMAGAKLVLPGARTDAQSVRVLADRETASLIIAGPAELQALYDQYRSENRRPSGLKRVIAAGAACPPALAKSWRDSFGVDARAAWGLVETSSVGGVSDPSSADLRPPFGLELEIMDGSGRALPHDGVATGRLMARGAVVAGGYFPGDRATGKDGYLDTGDTASVDPDGRVNIMGRAGDQILVDGALVSPRPMEDAALEHPSTAEAVVIDGPAGEGPVLVVQRRPGALAGKPDYLRFMADRLGGGPAPVDVLFVDALPRDGAGRIDRRSLRDRLAKRAATAAGAPAATLLPAAGPEASAAETPAPDQIAPLAAVAASAGLTPVLYAPDPTEPVTDAAVETVAEPGSGPAANPDAPVGAEPDLAESLAPAAGAIQSTEETSAAPEVPSDLEGAPAAPVEPGEGAATTEKPIALDDPDLVDLPFARLGVRPALTPAVKSRSRRRPGGPPGLFLSFTALVALAPVVLFTVGAVGIRAGAMEWSVGHDQLMIDWPFKLGMVGLVSGILGLFAALMAGIGRFWKRALISILVPIAVLAALIGYKARSDSFPPVHDVATDWNDPIMFSPALMRQRGDDANPVVMDPAVPPSAGAYMNRLVADVNAETCPGARPVLTVSPPAEAYARARQAVLALGLQLVLDDPKAGRLEAVATDPWLGLKDDLAVRVRPNGQGSKVDLRSISRYGQSDIGDNCDRVTRLVQELG